MADNLAGEGLGVAEKVLDIADALAPAITMLPGGAAVAGVVHGLDEVVGTARDSHETAQKVSKEAHADYKRLKSAFNNDPKDIVTRAHELNSAVTGGNVSVKSRIEKHRSKK